MKKDYDLVVIGGGSGGYAAAKKGAELGLEVALLDHSQELGGLCLLRGCMPSKTLIETANRMRELRDAERFGIRVPAGARVEMSALQARRQAFVSEFQDDRSGQLRDGGFDLIRERGRFVGPHEIALGEGSDERLSFRTAIVATGSQAKVPDLVGLSEVPYWTSKDALEAKEVPARLIVIGGGVIGCEMAHCYEGLGSQVTLIHRSDRLLGQLAPEVGDELARSCAGRLDLLLEATTREVAFRDGEFFVKVEVGDEVREICGDRLLIATGRGPNLKGLGLSEAGVDAGGRGIEVDACCQTTQRHIFAVGDCREGLDVVHHAVIEGEQAAGNAAGCLRGEKPHEADTRPAIFAVFSEPEVIHIGPLDEDLSEAEETEDRVFRLPEMGKAMIRGLETGVLKVTLERGSGRILSATGVGKGVIDFSHALVIAIREGLTLEQFLKVPHYHPTLTEAWTYLEP